LSPSIKNCSIAVLCFVHFICLGQKKKPDENVVQVSLLPGISTNGLDPGTYINTISINLTSGYSKGTMLFEFAAISNANEEKTQGLQIAGLGNITGINVFKGLKQKEKDSKMRSGFEANLTGLQLSGLANVVINNVFGGQLSGGVNVSKGALIGFQISGIGNYVHKFSFGLQLAGLFNSSVQSINGVQVAALSNYTDGGLYGLQLSIFNRADVMEGVNSFNNDEPSAIQIGLVNKANKMNGFQFGLINIAKRSQGTQIGLINIYKKGKDINTRDGTSIGLINWGDFGYLAAYSSDLFIQNYELATGTYYKNARMKDERFGKTIQNSLIYSRSSWGNQTMWGVGYGIKKMYFNRSEVAGMTAFRFFGYGIDLIHVNHQPSFEKNLSLLTKAKILVGTRLSPKIHSVYIFCDASLNYYQNSSGKGISSIWSSEKRTSENVKKWWPGFSLGVMLR
jgi:hypothetical protein